MAKSAKKGQKSKTFRENYFTKEILTDTIYKKGDKVFIILYPFNQPDNFKMFSGEILYHINNKDFSVEYAVKIRTGFDKREILKDYFHNNWFKTTTSSDPKDLNEYARKFSFTDYELVEETDKYFDFAKYSTFFRNHGEKFNFLINEAFVFDKIHVCAEYCTKMSIITLCNKIKDMHDIMCNDSLRQTNSKIYSPSTSAFFKMIRPLIVAVIEELGPEYQRFIEGDKILEFLNDYILNRRYRRMEFTKSRKKITYNKCKSTRKRERDI